MPNNAKKPEILPVSEAHAAQFWNIFVSRRAYVQQSDLPGGKSGKHYYFKPEVKKTKAAIPLSPSTMVAHLAGWLTVAVYAINPETQNCKWIAINADYASALDDLKKLSEAFAADGIESLPESSRRGGHLWIFLEEPISAAMCRLYVLSRARQLGVPVKKHGNDDGIEVFPKQDTVGKGEFGNAIRAPLGVHRASMERYWFEGAEKTLDSQLQLLSRVKRISKAQLQQLTADLKPIDAPKPKFLSKPFPKNDQKITMVSVPLGRHRKSGKNYVAECPACASRGSDRKGHHLSVLSSDSTVYHCFCGCSREEIKRSLGIDPNPRVWLQFAA
jgi:hypothetical protein